MEPDINKLHDLASPSGKNQILALPSMGERSIILNKVNKCSVGSLLKTDLSASQLRSLYLTFDSTVFLCFATNAFLSFVG